MSWKRALGILWFANFVTSLGMMSMVPFLTYFVEELGLENAAARNVWTGILVGAAPIVAAFMGPIWGGVGDRFGRKAMVLRALGAIVVFVGLMGLASSVWTMLALRVMQGCFSGFLPPSITLVSVQAPEEYQGRVAGTMNSAFPAGAAAGFLLGGAISEHLGPRWVFPVCSALALIGLVSVALFTREPTRSVARRASRDGGSILGSILRDGRFVLSLRRLAALLGAVIVVRGLVSTVDPHFARFVQELGGSPTLAGLILSTQALMLLICMPVWGAFCDRRGSALTFVLCAIGVAVSAFCQAGVEDVRWLFPLRAMNGVFLAGIFPAAYTLAARETDSERRGSAMGVVFMAIALSHAVGSTVSGGLLNAFGFRSLFVVIGVATLTLGAAGVFLIRRRTDGEEWRSGGKAQPPREVPSTRP